MESEFVAVGSEVIVSSGENDQVTVDLSPVRPLPLPPPKESEAKEVEGSTCKRKRDFINDEDEANAGGIIDDNENQKIEEDLQGKIQRLEDESNKCDMELEEVTKKLGVIKAEIAMLKTADESIRKARAEFEKLVAAPLT